MALSCFCGQPSAVEDEAARRPGQATARQRGKHRRGSRASSEQGKCSMLSRLIEGIVHLVEDDDDFTTASEGGSPRAGSAAPPLPEAQDSGHLTAGPSGSLPGSFSARRPSSARRSGAGEPGLTGAAAAAAGGGGAPPQPRPLTPPGGAVRQPAAAAQQQQQQQGAARHQRRPSAGRGSEGGYEEDEEEGEEGSGEESGEEGEGGQRRGAWKILGGVPFLPKIVELLSPKVSTAEEAEAGAAGAAGGGDEGNLEPPTSPGGSSLYPTLAAGTEEAQPRADDEDLQGTTTEPALLEPGQQPLPELSEPSQLMSEDAIRALSAAVPARYRQARWALLYSTARDGISLQTMLRNAAKRAPTVLVVRDFDRHVFGAYCSEAWKVDKRFFGTGESFVFQLEPRRAVWYWWWRRMAKEPNDYFQWCSPEAVAVGGSGGYALWLDADLSAGISRNSTTFGNDSLAGREEFRIGAVELWALS